MSSLIDEIRKALKGERKSEFIDQLLKEKSLYDALRQAGLSVEANEIRSKARERPKGVLSLEEKIQLVEQISELLSFEQRPNLIRNGDFEDGFAFWVGAMSDWVIETINEGEIINKKAAVIPYDESLGQHVAPFRAKDLAFIFSCKTNIANSQIRFRLKFTDATQETQTFTMAQANTWFNFYYKSTDTKRIYEILFDSLPSNDPDAKIWLTNVAMFHDLNLPSEYPLPNSQITSLKEISNFPTEYPLPSAQVTDLKTISNSEWTYKAIPSDNIQHSNDSEKSFSELNYTKKKEIKILHPIESCRIKFDMRASVGTVYGRIYKNGSPIGTERQRTATDYLTFSEDFSNLNKDDLIQLYCHVNVHGDSGFIRNFRICFDMVVTKKCQNTLE